MNLLDARCPVCGDPPEGDTWVCPSCRTILHADCRAYQDGCGTYGCRPAATICRTVAPMPATHPGRFFTITAEEFDALRRTPEPFSVVDRACDLYVGWLSSIGEWMLDAANILLPSIAGRVVALVCRMAGVK